MIRSLFNKLKSNKDDFYSINDLNQIEHNNNIALSELHFIVRDFDKTILLSMDLNDQICAFMINLELMKINRNFVVVESVTRSNQKTLIDWHSNDEDDLNHLVNCNENYLNLSLSNSKLTMSIDYKLQSMNKHFHILALDFHDNSLSTHQAIDKLFFIIHFFMIYSTSDERKSFLMEQLTNFFDLYSALYSIYLNDNDKSSYQLLSIELLSKFDSLSDYELLILNYELDSILDEDELYNYLTVFLNLLINQTNQSDHKSLNKTLYESVRVHLQDKSN